MTFGNMREQGVRNLSVYCRDCHHWPLLNVDHMPDDVEIQTIERRLVCSRCGSVGKSDTQPNWSERPPRARHSPAANTNSKPGSPRRGFAVNVRCCHLMRA